MLIVLLGRGGAVTEPPGFHARSAWPEERVSAASALRGLAQKALRAGDSPISVGAFRFRIVRAGFDATAMGFVPEDMSPQERLIFVEFELLSGNRDDFKGLELTVSGASGKKSKAAVLVSEGMMKALSALTMTNASPGFQPEKTNVAWAFVVQKDETDFSLAFPTGDVISLAPLLKKVGSEIARAAAQRNSAEPERDRSFKADDRGKNKGMRYHTGEAAVAAVR